MEEKTFPEYLAALETTRSPKVLKAALEVGKLIDGFSAAEAQEVLEVTQKHFARLAFLKMT